MWEALAVVIGIFAVGGLFVVIFLGVVAERGLHRALAWLYPAHDQIAVFMMAFLMLAIVAFKPEPRQGLWRLFVDNLIHSPLGTIVGFGFVAVSFAAALAAPFSKGGAQAGTGLVIVLHTLAMLVVNIGLAMGAPTIFERWVNLALALYFAGWLVFIRYRPDEDLVSARAPIP